MKIHEVNKAVNKEKISLLRKSYTEYESLA